MLIYPIRYSISVELRNYALGKAFDSNLCFGGHGREVVVGGGGIILV